MERLDRALSATYMATHVDVEFCIWPKQMDGSLLLNRRMYDCALVQLTLSLISPDYVFKY